MRFDVVTIFPEFFTGPLDYGIVRRARESGLIDVRIQDLREFTHDRHRTVDDRPFGGGEGMVLKPEPFFEAVESLLSQREGPASEPLAPPIKPGQQSASVERVETNDTTTAIVLLSASGKLFRQSTARRFAALDRVILLCGRYEGVDERVAEHLATEERSIGDFVLSGGELAAAIVIDAVTRLLPGALGNEASALYESFSAPQAPESGQPHSPGMRITPTASPYPPVRPNGAASYAESRNLLLDFPHYTRPADFRGWPVPEILLGGNHEEIRRWRSRMALEKTRRNRPDLLAEAPEK